MGTSDAFSSETDSDPSFAGEVSGIACSGAGAAGGSSAADMLEAGDNVRSTTGTIAGASDACIASASLTASVFLAFGACKICSARVDSTSSNCFNIFANSPLEIVWVTVMSTCFFKDSILFTCFSNLGNESLKRMSKSKDSFDFCSMAPGLRSRLGGGAGENVPSTTGAACNNFGNGISDSS